MLQLPRRQFLTGLGALIAAPAVVRAASLMPVKAIKLQLAAGDPYIIDRVSAYWKGSEFRLYIRTGEGCWQELGAST